MSRSSCRVLHVMRPAAGGMRRHLQLLIAMQTRQGLAVRVASPAGFGWEQSVPIPLSSRPHPFKDLQAAQQIAKLAKESDLIHAHGFRAAWVTAMALRRRKTPFLFTAHNLLPDNPGLLARLLLKFTFLRADTVICVSDYIREALSSRGLPAQKLCVVYNAVDADQFHPDKADSAGFRQGITVETDTPLLGIVGRIVPWKGHQDLIEALPMIRDRLPDAILAVIGQEDQTLSRSNSWTERLKRKAHDLKVSESIRWAGWREDVRPVYSALDVVCMPSRREPFGLSAVEAMAMQKPIVAYRSGALPEIIADGDTGFLTPEGDIQVFAERVITLLQSADMRHRMGESARQSVLARFHPQSQADAVLRLYESCLQIRGG